ncbi:MAG: reductive dehalogenase, partial [Acidobacteria bacterium]|nr:reductive dehalogenase [Acidobacteriota bacterium]
KWVVAIAVAMDQELMARCPTALGDAATSLGYSQCAFTVGTLAEFIRGLGYQAIPSVNDTAQSIPFAVDAGLGELSRLNRLVTPEYGAAVRLCKVFTDLPMACDEPIDFGAASYCKRCKMCAEACPAGALSFDDEPSYKVRGPWNNPGHKAWFEDAYKCYQQWQQVTTACSICFAVCPYTRCARAWAQDAARSVPQPGPPRVYPYVDGALNWEKQRDSGDWWEHTG